MSQQNSEVVWESFADFLANAPPGSEYLGDDFINVRPPYPTLMATPEIKTFCSGECQQDMYFDGRGADNLAEFFRMILTYTCRHCKNERKYFALIGEVTSTEDKLRGIVAKFGQHPPYGPHTPAKVLRLIQGDDQTYLKGRRAESLNLGIGAFTYYRRVVESQKDKLCDEMIRIAERLSYSTDIVDQLRAAKNNWQFKQGVESIKDAFPEAFKIAGHNPLALLHSALSDGVHNLTDEECLSRAQDARRVLTAMADKLSTLSMEQRELHESVARLVKKKAEQQL